MKSWRTAGFRRAFDALPKTVQRQAVQAYKVFANDSGHPSLQFKKVHDVDSIYSVRVTLGYRARDPTNIVYRLEGKHRAVFVNLTVPCGERNPQSSLHGQRSAGFTP